MRSRYLGLNFEAPFTLGEQANQDGPVDVTVRIGPTAPVPQDEPGPIAASFNPPGSSGYTVYDLGGSYLFRFQGFCEFRVSADSTNIACYPGPSCNKGLLEVLVGGTLAAWVHTLRGRAVLHASAVLYEKGAIVLAGRSGLGKSTLTALCCAAGAQLIGDDVVVLQKSPEGVASTGLGAQVRLRPQARGIADLFDPPLHDSRLTADGRLAIRPTCAATEDNLVSAVVLPRPGRGRSEVSLQRLEPVPALLALLANARVSGMKPAHLQRAYFEVASALAVSVPVLEACVPWGPPFSTATASELLRKVEAAARSVA